MTTPAQPNPPTPVMYRLEWQNPEGKWIPQNRGIGVLFTTDDPVELCTRHGEDAKNYRFLHPSGSLHIVRDGKLVEICAHGEMVGNFCLTCGLNNQFPGFVYSPQARSCARPLSEQQPEEVKQSEDRVARDLERKLAEAERDKDLRFDTMKNWKRHAAEHVKTIHSLREELTAANLRAERAVVALKSISDFSPNEKEPIGPYLQIASFAKTTARAILAEHPETVALADRVKELEADKQEIRDAIQRSGMGIMRTSQGPSGTRICYTPENEEAQTRRETRLISDNISLEKEVKDLRAKLDNAQVAMSILDSAAKLLTAQGRPCSAEEVARLIGEHDAVVGTIPATAEAATRLLNAAKGWGDAPECGVSGIVVKSVDAKEKR